LNQALNYEFITDRLVLTKALLVWTTHVRADMDPFAGMVVQLLL